MKKIERNLSSGDCDIPEQIASATEVPSLEVLKNESEKQLPGTVQVYLFLSSNKEKPR